MEAHVHAEVDRTLHGRLPDKDDLPKLQYINCVVKETLRLYPPTWLSARDVATECGLVIVVATIARQFRLRLADTAEVTPNPRTTLIPNQLKLLLEQRR